MRSTFLLISASLLLCSCGGTTLASTSSEAADSGAASGDAAPTGPLSAECDGVTGLTGQAVLDALNALPATLPAATFSRYVYPAGPPSVDDSTAATIQIRYESGATVTCNPAVPDPPGTPNPGVTPASVYITVQVDFATADGAFVESFPASIETTGVGSADLEFTGTVAVADIKGSYRSTAEADTAGSSTKVTFFGLLEAPNLAGTYIGGVVHGQAYGPYKFN